MKLLDAAQASAMAAVASAVAAIATLKLQRKIAHDSVRPELVPKYNFGDTAIALTNTGKGIATEIRLEATQSQWHILNTGQIIQYRLSDDTPRVVRPDETIYLKILQSERIAVDEIDLEDAGFDLFRFMRYMATSNNFSITFRNSLGKMMVIRFKFKEVEPNNFQLFNYSVRNYYQWFDWVRAKWFKLWKYPRQFWRGLKGEIPMHPRQADDWLLP